MNRCKGFSSKCLGGEPSPVFHPLMRGERTRLMCGACVAALNATGMDWRPEQRVDPERAAKSYLDRVRLPEWLARGQRGENRGIDLTGYGR